MITKEELYRFSVPIATSSYTPVSHKNVIEHLYEQLDKHHMVVSKEQFNVRRYGQQLIGLMDIQYSSDRELGMRLAFRNSYDKSMSVAFVAGAQAWICGNGMINGEFNFMRKHTGSVIHELDIKITDTINQLDAHFLRMVGHANIMKGITIEPRTSAELAGRLFIEKDIITSQQLNIVKKEILKPSYEDFADPTLWSFYNHTTEALKKSHPTTYINQHKSLHEFIVNEFSL
jgi:hypothetical protein